MSVVTVLAGHAMGTFSLARSRVKPPQSLIDQVFPWVPVEKAKLLEVRNQMVPPNCLALGFAQALSV